MVRKKSGSIIREDEEVITLDRTTMLTEKQILVMIQESCNTQPLKSIYSIKVRYGTENIHNSRGILTSLLG